ncbi:TSUP family transporter, partial [Arthrospira platensis SPKY1]|nr:TSUP family transporter [Arthrospira platensis SPKY1]
IEKAGVKGLSMPAVSIYAAILGGKASAGLILLLFMLADLLAVRHYRRSAQFSVVIRLLGPAAIGVVIGAMVGHYVDDQLFKDMLAVIILVCLLLMFFPQFSSQSIDTAQKPLLGRAVGL